MDFSLYKTSNEQFIKENKNYMDKYPNAFVLFEKYLRTKADISNSKNADQLILNYGDISFFKFLYRLYIKFILSFKISNKNPSCYIYNLDRFPSILQKFNNNKRIELTKKPKSILEYISINTIDIHKLLSSNYKIIKFYRKLSKSDVSNILEDEEYMRLLNKVVINETTFMLNILNKYNICTIVSSNDDDPYMRILCNASNLAKSDVNIIAHGYIGHKSLLSIAPIYADRLFVWTKKQKNDLINYLDENNANKIKYQGSPLLITDNKPNNIHSNRVLFALGYLTDLDTKNSDTFLLIDKYVTILLNYNFDIEIRFHPQNDVNSFPFLNNYNGKIFISKNISVYDSILSARFVITTPSSIILQAAHNNINVFQIQELSEGNHYENSVIVNLNNFEEKIKIFENEIITNKKVIDSLVPEFLVNQRCLII
jgi:hypothetical protein